MDRPYTQHGSRHGPNGSDPIPGGIGGGVGSSELIYRYTVTGSDKDYIDTSADTADAGSNDWTDGDLLEIFVYGRSTQASDLDNLEFNLNNDYSASYDREFMGVIDTTVYGVPTLADTKWAIGRLAGDNLAAGTFASFEIRIPNYTGTVGHKMGTMQAVVAAQAAAAASSVLQAIGWRSTSAITRLTVAPDDGNQLKVGSQLLIYKRLAS